MNYDPSHRRPPRQQRWPNATPRNAWPAYQQDQAGQVGQVSQATWPAEAMAVQQNNGYAPAPSAPRTRPNSAPWGDAAWDGGTWDGDGWNGDGWSGAAGQGHQLAGASYGGVATAYPAPGDLVRDGFDGVPDGYAGVPDGYAGAAEGYAGAAEGYAGAAEGYAGPADDYAAAPEFAADNGFGGWDGYRGTEPEATGPAGYPEHPAGYPKHDEYRAADSGASSVLIAPDMMGEWWRPPDEDAGADREEGRDSLVIGAVMGFLSAAVALGVATLAGALVRPQASPVSVIGAVLLGRLPAGPRATVIAHLGAHGGSVLLLGLAAAVAIVAGVAARRNTGFWVAGLAAAGLLGAFVAVTRPGSRAIDVLPPAAGVVAGIAALLWLARAAAPLTTGPLTTGPVTTGRASSRRPGYRTRRPR